MSASKSIAIIDYGMGNLHSVASALAHVAPGSDIRITQSANDVAAAERVIFPGVGAIRDCVAEIKAQRYDLAVAEALDSGKPVLAICVGMQSLMARSDENGGADCLNIFPGEVKLFSDEEAFRRSHDESSASMERLKVPHMGWNEVCQTRAHPLWADIPQNSRFYFVHSYFVRPQDPLLTAAETHYGLNFTSVIAKDNLFAVQFHPEKSHIHGLQLLKNFVHWDGDPAN